MRNESEIKPTLIAHETNHVFSRNIAIRPWLWLMLFLEAVVWSLKRPRTRQLLIFKTKRPYTAAIVTQP